MELNYSINVDFKCECCLGSEYEYISTKRGCKICQCRKCGLFSVYPLPSKESLSEIYSNVSGYHSTLSQSLPETPPDYAKYLSELLSGLFPNKGSLLDVGCSNGQLIYHLRELGWQVKGIDINPDSIRIADSHGLDVEQCEVTQLDVGILFDVIHMGDVIEHLDSPSTALEAAFKLLQENGVLIANTPNADCGFGRSTQILSKFTGFPWPQSEAPFHLYEFTGSTLVKFLTKSGFKVFSTKHYGGSSLPYIIGGTGYFDKLKQKLKSKGTYHFKCSIVPYIPALCAITLLLTPFYIAGKVLDRIQKKGTKIRILAIKSKSYSEQRRGGNA